MFWVIAALAAVAANPIPIEPASWIGVMDYPSVAATNGWNGTVAFSLEVTAAGHVASCTVTTSSGHPELDDGTCELLKRRAEFKPALDEKGQAIPGTYKSRVNWTINANTYGTANPCDRSWRVAQMRSIIEDLDVDHDNRISAAEWQMFVERSVASAGPQVDKDAMRKFIEEDFRRRDSDGDGFLTLADPRAKPLPLECISP